MAIATTTPSAIRIALVPLIKALTPTVKPALGWHYVKDGHIAGQARTFTIANGASSEQMGAFHGGGNVSHEFDMSILVSYGGMSPDAVEEMRDGDMYDLWDLLHPVPDNGASGIAGVLAFRNSMVAEVVNDDDGDVVLEYRITIPYNRASTLG